MKLDDSVVSKIVNGCPWLWKNKRQMFEDFLKSLDLVIKQGDSSQATLVENNANFVENDSYLCKDCGKEICGNYVTGHFDCIDIHPRDRKSK